MKRYLLAATGFAVSAALAMACDSKTTAPTLVNDSPAQTSPAAADGSTLKVTAPVPLSPLNDVVVEDAPTLVAAAVAGKYGAASVQYEFEVYNDQNVKVQTNVSATPSLAVAITLEFDKRYTWRVRGTVPAQNAHGPWSAFGSFKSPAGGYIHTQEIFDPLTNGKTVGGSSFDVTFTPDGIKLNGQESFVEYAMPQTLTAGELSAIITNLGNGSEEWKTKVLSMLAGDGVNITDNEYRVTLDKRTGWVGQGSPARYTFCVRPDCVENNAGPQSWDRTHLYFWKFTWGNGVSRLVILDGGTNGTQKVNISASYKGTWSPAKMLVRLGSVRGRAGSDTNPGTVIRNLWVSALPRPNFKGDTK